MVTNADIFSLASHIETSGSNVRLTYDQNVPAFPDDVSSTFACTHRDIENRYIDLEIIDPTVLVEDALDDLIEKLPVFPKSETKVYLIDRRQWFSTHDKSNQSDPLWARYLSTAKLASLLEEVSDFKRTEHSRRVFTLIGASRLEVKIDYRSDTLADCADAVIDKVQALLTKPGSIGFASSIIKNNAIRLMRHCALPDRFAKLASICDVFCDNCLGDHSIYCNGDGYSSAVSDLVKSSTDLIKSLNGAFSAMYGKLLLVPAAFIYLHIKMAETTDAAARSGLLWVMALFILVTVATAIMHFRSIWALRRNVTTEKDNLLLSGALPKDKVDNSFASMLVDIRIQGVALLILLLLYFGLFIYWAAEYSASGQSPSATPSPETPPAESRP